MGYVIGSLHLARLGIVERGEQAVLDYDFEVFVPSVNLTNHRPPLQGEVGHRLREALLHDEDFADVGAAEAVGVLSRSGADEARMHVHGVGDDVGTRFVVSEVFAATDIVLDGVDSHHLLEGHSVAVRHGLHLGDHSLSGIFLPCHLFAQLLDDIIVKLLAALVVILANLQQFLFLLEVFIGDVDDMAHAQVVFQDGLFEARNAAKLVVPAATEDAPPARVGIIRPARTWNVDGEAKPRVLANQQTLLDVGHGVEFINNIGVLNLLCGGILVPLGAIQVPVDQLFLVEAPAREHGFAVNDAFDAIALAFWLFVACNQQWKCVAEMGQVGHDLHQQQRDVVPHIPVVGLTFKHFLEGLHTVGLRVADDFNEFGSLAVGHFPVEVGVGANDFGGVNLRHHLLG